MHDFPMCPLHLKLCGMVPLVIVALVDHHINLDRKKKASPNISNTSPASSNVEHVST